MWNNLADILVQTIVYKKLIQLKKENELKILIKQFGSGDIYFISI